jgi:hypothetical protein
MNLAVTILYFHHKDGFNQLMLLELFQNQDDMIEHLHIKISPLNLLRGLVPSLNFI